MFVRSTIIKSAIVITVIAVIILAYQTWQENKPTATPTTSPSTVDVTVTPQALRPGWTKDNMNQLFNACPVKAFTPGLCTCAIDKLSHQYTFDEAQKMYTVYTQTKQIDPRLSQIIQSCE